MNAMHPDRSQLAGVEQLTGAERREVLGHVAACAACREAYLSHDPSRVFGLLALSDVPAETLDQVSHGVAAALDGARAGRRSPGLRSVVALAAGVLLAVLLFVSGDEAPVGTPADLAGMPPVEELMIDPGFEPEFELLSSPGEAQVVDLAMGEVRLVMIYDESLDL